MGRRPAALHLELLMDEFFEDLRPGRVDSALDFTIVECWS
jgi:hypothetical protein